MSVTWVPRVTRTSVFEVSQEFIPIDVAPLVEVVPSE